MRGGTIGGRRDRLRLRIRTSGQLAAAEAVAEERRRIAAEVHDLIMQDLAIALGAARALTGDPAVAERAAGIVEAGERALAGARELVDNLVNRDRPPVIDAIEASARAAARHVHLAFDAHGVAPGSQPDGHTLDALVHVAREAVTNATKHAAPSSVRVVLDHSDEWRLTVTDDGAGFDELSAHGGFGLKSMRAHAHALGGRLHVLSEPGAGTTVQVILP
jgi:signal transduction histidine kinase